MNSTHKLVYLSLLIALGTVLHTVEGMLLIPVPIPGVKLGMANIVTLMALCTFGVREGLTVALMRVFLGSLISGMFLAPGFFLALGGALASTLTMAILMKFTRSFSIIGISVAGAVGHNIGQLLTASAILQNKAVLFYLPILLMSGVPTGFITGYLLKSLQNRIELYGIPGRF